ncbi:hypothetical protein GCM10011329_25540 [Stakelama pacifica]|nr:hypothetical protein GCM10011329_25540 [Stakelama pacifica]
MGMAEICQLAALAAHFRLSAQQISVMTAMPRMNQYIAAPLARFASGCKAGFAWGAESKSEPSGRIQAARGAYSDLC